MSAETSILAENDANKTKRFEYVTGLRQLADFVEAHPELPIPWAGSHNAFVYTKADLATAARSGLRWDKGVSGDYFFLRVDFAGGHSYELNVQRDQVCRKVKTGTAIVAAQPEREVETYEWVCDEPLLAGAK